MIQCRAGFITEAMLTEADRCFLFIVVVFAWCVKGKCGFRVLVRRQRTI